MTPAIRIQNALAAWPGREAAVTPTERIAYALAVWPGREVDVAAKVEISKSLLRMWSGKPGGRHTLPSEGDANRVETAIRALLQDRIAKLVAKQR